MQREIAWLLQEKYQGKPTAAFERDVARLQQGEPLAYVIGHIPFLHTTITLDSHPLIPRTETEYWTSMAISALRSLPNQPPHILDLCAGSGCIGVAMGQALPNSQLTFSELDPAHIPTIEENCRRNDITPSRYTTYTGDLFDPLPRTATFDMIVTNPPYIDPARDRTTTAVREHEPATALYGGTAGLDIIARILQHAARHLRVHGQLWIEHEPEQVTALPHLTPPTLQLHRTHNDQYEVPRVSVWTVAV